MAARRVVPLLVACAVAIGTLLIAAPVAQASAPVGVEQDAPVDTLTDVESAVVQIEAVGSFMDPEEGRLSNVPGFGSGFIIDPSGIAVTNNHVVTGGALFRVYVSGRERPVNARVLGVSECLDLAVIDLQGDGYPYLEWYEGEAEVALPVYSAGFPLGEPQYALTSGIISKDDDYGETSWSSVDYVLMHDADIRPGNSGGPLVTADGQVVGVNYAGDDENRQNFAIPGAIARAAVETLRSGVDIDSLGLNAEAFDDGDLAYIYVYSVESGSPADVVGILPGDLIVELEGLIMGLNNEMVEYCDILASHDRNDVLSVVVYRPDTDELLEGQINGRPLEPEFSISGDDSTRPGDDEIGVADDQEGYTFESVSSDAGVINLEVPTAWSDRAERDWISADDELWGTQYLASPDLEAFFDDWNVPGVIFGFSETLQDELTPDDLLELRTYDEACDYNGRIEWPEDSFYSGAYDEYVDCGGQDVTTWVVALLPESEEYMLGIELYGPTSDDLDALDHILDTFYIEAGGSSASSDAPVGADIFGLVDVDGLEHEYTLLREPFFSALVPAVWDEISSEDWVVDDEVIGKKTLVSPDIERYQEKWDQEGLQAFILSDLEDGFDTEVAQDAVDFSDECTFEERLEHEHSIYGLTYSGYYDVYTDCKGSDNIFYSGSFVEGNGDHAILIDFVSMSAADDEAWEVLLQSFFLPSAVKPDVNTTEFATVTDQSGRISLAVPIEWEDDTGGPWEVDGDVVGIEATFSTNVRDFDESWEVAGVYINVWDDFGSDDAGDVLDIVGRSDECTFDDRFDYEGERFTGQYDLYTDCGDVEGMLLAQMALFPVDNPETLVLVELAMPTRSDRAILEPILNTLQVAPLGE
jgi:serine protease Do